ncbi:MAG TPA: calcium-binding protein [Sphingomicrobium sp.]|nr:calcium-binding protein [Sphingomicrobium sp.]
MPHIEGTSGDDTVVGTSDDDLLLGLGGADTLDGLAGDDQLEGGEGPDRLFGRAGFDYASYLNARFGQVADLAIPSANVGNEAEGDSYDGIEGLIGSIFRDSLRGDAGNNYIFGMDGNDSLYGRAGIDTLAGGSGDDFLEGGQGVDYLIGGAGLDHALYTTSLSGVTVDLLNQSANTGDAAGDFFDSIEALAGSAFNDSLRGTGADEYLVGEAGRDSLYGRGGNDTLLGGDGDDYLTGGEGGDLLIGGAGIDIAMYTHSTEGVYVTLSSNRVQGGEALGDTFIGIEGLAGSPFSDTLFGDSGNNLLFGEGGDDVYLAGLDGDDALVGGPGNDVLFGGRGQDIYVFGVGDGHDRIADMMDDRGHTSTPIDVIHLSRALGVNSFADVMARAQQVGTSTVITFDANTSIELSSATMSLLTPDNFVFTG